MALDSWLSPPVVIWPVRVFRSFDNLLSPNGLAMSGRRTDAREQQPSSCRAARAPCSASPLTHFDDSSNRTKGFVDRFAVGEHLRYVGIKHHNVRSLRVPLRVLPADTPTKIIVLAHLIAFAGGFLHTPSARPGLPDAR
jgi:hypothetical protein